MPLNYIQCCSIEIHQGKGLLNTTFVILISSTVPKEVYKQEGLEGDNSRTRQDMGHKVRPSRWLSKRTVGWEWERSVFLGAKDSSCTQTSACPCRFPPDSLGNQAPQTEE